LRQIKKSDDSNTTVCVGGGSLPDRGNFYSDRMCVVQAFGKGASRSVVGSTAGALLLTSGIALVVFMLAL
jgi:hypothetical protein